MAKMVLRPEILQEMLKEDDEYAQYIDSLDNSNISLEDLPVYPGINVSSKTC